MGNGYKKLALLGEGATAQVYMVEDIKNGKRYAMKEGKDRELLKKEAGLLQAVKGVECFPTFVEYLETEGAIIMEYLEGKDLQSLLEEVGCLESGEAVYIMGEVLGALGRLHKYNPPIIYRDLKPANIILCRDGKVCLIDLGAACYKGEMGHAGTYGYGAPEQFWEGVIVDTTCDIYSAGKVFFYMLTGKNPAEPPYDVEAFCKNAMKKNEDFLEVLERSLSFSPQARYETTDEMWKAIQYAGMMHGGAIRDGRKGKKILSCGRKKTSRIYEKCIWKSEYRRIF